MLKFLLKIYIFSLQNKIKLTQAKYTQQKITQNLKIKK